MNNNNDLNKKKLMENQLMRIALFYEAGQRVRSQNTTKLFCNLLQKFILEQKTLLHLQYEIYYEKVDKKIQKAEQQLQKIKDENDAYDEKIEQINAKIKYYQTTISREKKIQTLQKANQEIIRIDMKLNGNRQQTDQEIIKKAQDKLCQQKQFEILSKIKNSIREKDRINKNIKQKTNYLKNLIKQQEKTIKMHEQKIKQAEYQKQTQRKKEKNQRIQKSTFINNVDNKKLQQNKEIKQAETQYIQHPDPVKQKNFCQQISMVWKQVKNVVIFLVLASCITYIIC